MQWPWHPCIYGKVTLQGHGTHTLLENQMNVHVCMHSLFYFFKWSQHESITELEAVGGYPIMMNKFKKEGGGLHK